MDNYTVRSQKANMEIEEILKKENLSIKVVVQPTNWFAKKFSKLIRLDIKTILMDEAAPTPPPQPTN